MFKIESKDDKYFVVPTAEYLLEHFDRFSFPYDSNWEIYKLFNYPFEDFLKYIISVYEAKVTIQYTCPWVNFYFPTYSKAEAFQKELEKRSFSP